jgi:hypothetical protein
MKDVSRDQLEVLLAEALEEVDPVPDFVVAAAKDAFIWRTIDAELAELVFDSSDGLVGVRSQETARQVTFRAPGVEIEMMMLAEGGRRLVGQLVPPQQATVELRHGTALQETTTDAVGRFSFTDVPTGPVSLTIVTPDGGRVTTEWLSL